MATGTAQERALREPFPEPPTDLLEEDGVPLESDWHRLAMTLLIELVGIRLEGRDDYFVGGNMFIYFNRQQARARDFRGPDFFFVWEVPLNPPRRYWAVWDEGGKYPDMIIELASPSTLEEDHGVKKHIYERVFHTSEYFIYDPASQTLQGWRLDDSQRYQPIKPNDKGWLWCERLGLWLGTWSGKYQGKQEVYLRFYDKDGNLIPSADERRMLARLQAASEKERAEAEKHRADAEKKRADAEKKQAEEERMRADAEKKRADAAEAELAKLKSKRKKSK